MFVEDAAFPLSKNCLKLFPEKNLDDRKKVFNYRLSRYRRVSENAFGILSNVFRIFHTKINLNPDKAIKIVLKSLVLHNLLRTKSASSYTPSGFTDHIVNGQIIDGEWRKNRNQNSVFKDLPPARRGNNHKRKAEEIRDAYADYFYSSGTSRMAVECVGVSKKSKYER